MLLSIVINLLSSVNGTQSASQAASPLLHHGGATQPHDCREFQISGAATLKLREPNDVRTNGAERRLVWIVWGNEWNDRHARMNVAKPVVNNEEYGK